MLYILFLPCSSIEVYYIVHVNGYTKLSSKITLPQIGITANFHLNPDLMMVTVWRLSSLRLLPRERENGLLGAAWNRRLNLPPSSVSATHLPWTTVAHNALRIGLSVYVQDLV